MVESMSATSNFFSRSAAGWTITSTPSIAPSAKRMTGSWIGAARHSMSAALPSSTQLHSLAEMLASPSTSLAVIYGIPRQPIGCYQSDDDQILASGRACRRSDRQRQVGAGARLGQAQQWRDRQRRRVADLPRSGGAERPAERGGNGARSSIDCSASAMAPSPARRRIMRRWRERRSPKSMPRDGCRSWSAGPGFMCGRCSTGSRRSRRSTRTSGARCARERRREPRRLARRPIPTRRRGSMPATRRESRGRWRSRCRPGGRWPNGRTDARAESATAITLRPLILLPPRDWLNQRCDERFAAMLDGGAVAEVEALLARKLDPDLPVMRAIGVREIAAMLRGELTREQALAAGQLATRRYAKRQYTWFAHQPPLDWPRFARAARRRHARRGAGPARRRGVARRHGLAARRRHRPCPACRQARRDHRLRQPGPGAGAQFEGQRDRSWSSGCGRDRQARPRSNAPGSRICRRSKPPAAPTSSCSSPPTKRSPRFMRNSSRIFATARRSASATDWRSASG